MKAITTKILPATNTLCCRIKAFDCTGNSLTISANDELEEVEGHRDAALRFAEKMEWKWSERYMHTGAVKDGYVHVIVP